MHKTAVYRLVKGGNAGQKQQISGKRSYYCQYIDTWAMSWSV